MKIKYQSLEKLTRWEVYQLYTDVMTLAEMDKEEKGELYAAALLALQKKFEALDAALVQEKETSEILIQADEVRDYAVRKIHTLALEYADYRVDLAKEKAAILVVNAYKPYGAGRDIARMAQDAETGVITNLLQDLEKEPVKPALESLGFAPLLNLLKINNQQFGTERISKTQAKAAFVAGVVKKTRQEAQDAFKKFCETVNALIIVEGSEKFETLVPQLNTRIQDGITTAKLRIEHSRAEKLKKEEKEKKPSDPDKPDKPEKPAEPETPETEPKPEA